MAGRFSSLFKAASLRQLLETATVGTLMLNTNLARPHHSPYVCPAHLTQLILTTTDLNEDHWEGVPADKLRGVVFPGKPFAAGRGHMVQP